MVTLEADNLWYGYIYSNNQSRVTFSEEVTPKLGGLVVSNRELNSTGCVELLLRPKEDDIIVLRRTAGDCTFGMTSKVLRH